MKRLLLFIFVLFFFISKQGWAVKVSTLYQADIPIASQSEDLKEQAVRDGFSQVLMKVSSDPQLLINPIIKQDLSRADYYVKEISYSTVTKDSSQYHIRIQYEPRDVNRLLQKAGVAYWGDNRPLILVWLVVTNQSELPEIIGTETPGDVINKMNDLSKRYGLPLVFPMMDGGEMNHILPKDILEKDLPKLKEAAKRYGADALLIGSIKENETGSDSEWQLIMDTDQWDFTLTDKTTGGVIASTVDEVSQTLAKRFVVESGGSIPELWLNLEITKVTARSELVKLMQYLEDLSLVKQVELSQISGEVVDLSVLIKGSLSAFQQSTSADNRLVFKSKDEKKNKLIYEWMH